MTSKKKVAIIGTGNLGLSITEGLIRAQSNFQIIATKRTLQGIEHLESQGVQITTDNIYAVQNSQIILFALKPYKILSVIKELSPYLTEHHIIVSLATGVSIANISENSGNCGHILRAMPNVASSVNQSATCISKNGADTEVLNQVQQVFNAIGETVIINEELMESATVLGACGTAFALRFIRAMVQAGIQIGFDSKTATKIANQTVKGAAEILLSSGNHPEAEIDKVTTPKGITITGLNEMEHHGFSASLIQGILASYRKIEGK